MISQYKSVVILLLVHSFLARQNNALADDVSHSSGCEPGSDCDADDPRPCPDKLFRWNPVKVGYTREISLDTNGKKIKMITRAVQPPIFEIPEFLTDEECDHIVNKAEDIGMAKSSLHFDPRHQKHKNLVRSMEGHSNSSAGYFLSWDANKDNEISMDEMIMFAERYKHLYLSHDEMQEMIDVLEIKGMDDGKVTYLEWNKFPSHAIETYFNDMKENHPHHRDRFSEQLWLFQGKKSDSIMRKLKEKVRAITRLSKSIIYGSEPLQVVKYDVRGHYHAHYDANRKADFPNLKCCHFDLTSVPHCRLCRYITILYYLNDVEKGGETAFPVADAPSYNETEFKDRKDGDRFNLSKFCKTANVVIKPRKRTAVLWYNFLLDDKSGWIGERDDRSLHGGCDIHKGIKYMANNWIPTPDADSEDLESNYSIFAEEDTDDDDDDYEENTFTFK